ncbi:MAG: LuxR C-terminal-related transcriptional regulator, partial [Coriobacteriaceae bacterium]|nr:LuxR C-terminal-related transcriptional regulator [Coriobacteriaceae bacterium]
RSATEHYLDPRNRQDPHYAEALALIANVLSLRADYQESQRLATRALELLPPSDFFLRQTASQAREYANPTIDYLSYRDMLLEYLPQVVAHGHQLYKANMFAFLADTEGNLGNLAAALEYIRCSVEVSDKNLHPERPTFMAIHRARMNVAYHRSSLGEAEIYRRQFEKVTKASYSFPSLALALAYAAFFSYLRGDLGQVEPCLKESLRLSPSGLLGLTPSLSFISYLEDSGLVDLRRYMDQLPPSFRKVREYKRMAFILPYVEGGVLPLDSLRRGVSAIESARRFDQVQGHILLALYEERAGQGEAAEQAMRKALAWAEPEQMSQVFLSDHEHVLPLVERLENTAEQSSFARSLRARLSQLATGEAKLEDDTEGQRLTMRENEVVYFLAAGYKLHEIAEQLGISKETVRKHIANSYRKLEVHSRTQLLLKLQ